MAALIELYFTLVTLALTLLQIFANFKVHQVSPEFSGFYEMQKMKPARDVPLKIGARALVCSRSL